jgi:hypothetical protein
MYKQRRTHFWYKRERRSNNVYYPTNQRHAPNIARLPLVIKVGTSPILHKLRRAAKTRVSFLPSPVLGLPSLIRVRLTLPDQR